MTAKSELEWSATSAPLGEGAYLIFESKDTPARPFGVFVFWRIEASEIRRTDNRNYARFGLAITSHDRNKGLGTEVNQAMFNYLTHTHGLDHLVARINSENLASLATVKKQGFQQLSLDEGSSRLFFVKPAFQD
jgi:RimJ/RimL family protein N-acetyltransferase